MEFWFRLSVFIMKTLFLLVNRIRRYFIQRGENEKNIPPWESPLSKASAVSVAEMINRREVSSEAVVRAYIERIKEVDRRLNAVVDERFEEALAEARKCDETLASAEPSQLTALRREQPLFGVPITVKESCSVKGLSLTGGSLIRRGVKATADSTAVQLLRSAGAIPLCVTNTPEMCSNLESANRLYGRTNNPYDQRRTPGGSSGGEAALIGAGASLIGIGSDIAGSLRVPALFNGIFAHKPTPGILPITGHYPMSEDPAFQRYLVLGPLTRYAEDLCLSMKLLSANCPVNLRLDEGPLDISKLRIFTADCTARAAPMCVLATQPAIRRCIANALGHLRGKGAALGATHPIPFDNYLEILVSLLFGIESMPKILIDPDNPKEEKKAVYELLKGMFGLSQYTMTGALTCLINELGALIPTSRRKEYQAEGAKVRQRFTELLADDGILLLPSYPWAAPLQKSVGWVPVEASCCIFANVFGLPSSHVPMGLDQEGMPVGFQVIAGPYQDRLCLGVARELEKAFGGWIPPSES